MRFALRGRIENLPAIQGWLANPVSQSCAAALLLAIAGGNGEQQIVGEVECFDSKRQDMPFKNTCVTTNGYGKLWAGLLTSLQNMS